MSYADLNLHRESISTVIERVAHLHEDMLSLIAGYQRHVAIADEVLKLEPDTALAGEADKVLLLGQEIVTSLRELAEAMR